MGGRTVTVGRDSREALLILARIVMPQMFKAQSITLAQKLIFTSNLQYKSCLYVLCCCVVAAKQREGIKECLTAVKQVFYLYQRWLA